MTLPEFMSINDGYPDFRNRKKIYAPRNEGISSLIHRIHSLEKDMSRLYSQEDAFTAHLRTSSEAFHELMVEKKQITTDLNHIRRASSCLIEASTLIRSCTNPANLLPDLCSIFVQWGYPLAMAFQVSSDSLIIRAIAGAGYSEVHLPFAGEHRDEFPLIRTTIETMNTTAGKCMHRPVPTFTDPDLCKLPLSVLSIPLGTRHKSPVCIMVYEQAGEIFTEEDTAILAEIGHLVPGPLLDFILD